MRQSGLPLSHRFDALTVDLRHAIRALSRSRGYTISAVLTLALGVGANAAVFSATWHLLLKPLPWPEADRLIHVWNTNRATGTVNVLAAANYLDLATESTRLESIAAYTFFNYSLNMTDAGEPLEARRRSEIGLRLALGARRSTLVQLITARAVAPVGAGVALGLGGAWLAARAVSPYVVGVSATDPRLFASAAVTLVVIACVAALIPIRRAASVDPVSVLRDV